LIVLKAVDVIPNVTLTPTGKGGVTTKVTGCRIVLETLGTEVTVAFPGTNVN
jgi:hypothetical protein